MALNTQLIEMPSWLRPRSPWTQSDVGQALRAGVEHKQRQQEMALQLRQLYLREQAQTVMNETRLQRMEDSEAELADMPLLQEYARNPDSGIPVFKSPKSYQKLQAIDLARSRSDLGKQNAADIQDFNRRLTKVDARDRFEILEMQKQGAPAGQVWDALSVAEEKQRIKATAEKQYAPDSFQKAVEYAQQLEADGATPELIEKAWERAGTIARGGKDTTKKTAADTEPSDGEQSKKPSFLDRIKQAIMGTPAAATTNAAPAAAMAGKTPQQHIDDANDAIQRGAPRDQVVARLKELGIAFDEAKVPEGEVRDALSEMVRDAIEAKPIAP